MKLKPQFMLFAWALAGFLLLDLKFADAVSFDIKPIKIFFDAKVKAEKLTITNRGDDEFTLQLKVYKWSQNAGGQDAYEDTGEIILFPKLLKLQKGEERIVRVGTKSPATAVERTYRVYVEEIPTAQPGGKGAEVHLLMKAGLPLFIAPLKPEERGKIESIALSKGNIGVTVHNEGNVHFSVTSIDLRGKNRKGDEVFSKSFAGWYILAGASRVYSQPVPRETCGQLSGIDVEVKTENFTLKGRADVTADMCQP